MMTLTDTTTLLCLSFLLNNCTQTKMMTSLKKVVIAKKPLIINVSAIFVQKVMTT